MVWANFQQNTGWRPCGRRALSWRRNQLGGAGVAVVIDAAGYALRPGSPATATRISRNAAASVSRGTLPMSNGHGLRAGLPRWAAKRQPYCSWRLYG